jgi:hypothetical protein
MVPTGSFGAGLNAVEGLFAKLNLLDSRNQHVVYSRGLPGAVRDLTYIEEYQCYLDESLFDFRLTDRSILQFKHFGEQEISYCYYQSPFDVPSYRDFLAEQFGPDPEAIEAAGDSFADDYSLAIDTARLRKNLLVVRYDFDPGLYEHGVHPAAHIHFGQGNEIRISVRRLMEPMSFALFIIRQLYPESWRRFLEWSDAHIVCRAVRENLEMVEEGYYNTWDKLQLVLE